MTKSNQLIMMNRDADEETRSHTHSTRKTCSVNWILCVRRKSSNIVLDANISDWTKSKIDCLETIFIIERQHQWRPETSYSSEGFPFHKRRFYQHCLDSVVCKWNYQVNIEQEKNRVKKKENEIFCLYFKCSHHCFSSRCFAVRMNDVTLSVIP